MVAHAESTSQKLETLRAELITNMQGANTCSGGSASGGGTSSTPQAAPVTQVPEAQTAVPLDAPVFKAGAGGTRASEKCEMWQAMGNHSLYAVGPSKSTGVGKLTKLENRMTLYEWGLSLLEALEGLHPKRLATSAFANLTRSMWRHRSATSSKINMEKRCQ